MSSYISPGVGDWARLFVAEIGAWSDVSDTPPEIEAIRLQSRSRHARFGGRKAPMLRSETISVRTASGAVRCVVNVPVRSDGPLPIVLYLHGGGLVMSTPEDFSATTTGIAALSGAIVVAPDYRLAPEHPFPAPLDDSFAVMRWLQSHGQDLGGDPGRIVTVGDSAGGYLALALAVEAARQGTPRALHQILLYPQADMARRHSADAVQADDPDVRAWAAAMASQIAFAIDSHAGAVDKTDPRVSPIHAPDFSVFPPTTLVAAPFDVLIDEGRELVDRMRAAGVPAQYLLYEGTQHGFINYAGLIPVAREAIGHISGVVRAATRSDN